MGITVLVVEADMRLARALLLALRRCGYAVEHRDSARAALQPAWQHDLILLDLALPDGDGVEVCRTLRARTDAGLIALAGRGADQARVNCLRAGADDCVGKPFHFPELRARIESVLRRVGPRPAEVYRVGDLSVDVGRHEASIGDAPVRLRPKEFDLLRILASRPGAVHHREHLMRQVWQTGWHGASRTVDVHVASLRPKLSGAGVAIVCVRGVGYRLVPEECGSPAVAV